MALRFCIFLFVVVFSVCGQSNKFSHLNERIVNGIPSRASQYPYIASLSIAFVGSSLYPRCGGSILRKDYPAIVVTAAHCIIDEYRDKYPISVDLYRDDVHPEQPGDSGHYTRWKSLYTTYHPYFNATTFDNDIGLVFLDANLTNYQEYREVSIPQNITYNNSCCHDHDTLTIIGYGYSAHDGEATDTLEYSTVSFMNRTQCNKQLSAWYIREYNYTGNDSSRWIFATENQICAMGNDTDACQGDSGGPLMKFNTNEQIGIISTGFGCNQNIPGIYTNLGLYQEWIHQQIQQYQTRMVTTTHVEPQHRTPQMETTELDMNGTEEAGNMDANMQEANLQLAIGCSIAGLCLLCVVATFYVVQRRRQKEAEEKYNRMKEENQLNNDAKSREKAAKTEVEGASDVVPIATNIQIEMKDTKLISDTVNDIR